MIQFIGAEKLTFAHVVRKCHTFMVPVSSLVFTRALSLNTILRRLNPVHALYLLNHPNIILPSTTRSPKLPLIQGFPKFYTLRPP